MMTISCIHLLMINTPDAMEKRKDLWDTVKERDQKLYRKLRYRTLSGGTYLPLGRVGDKATMGGYKLAQSIYKFN